jgi:hypothetical protein
MLEIDIGARLLQTSKWKVTELLKRGHKAFLNGSLSLSKWVTELE